MFRYRSRLRSVIVAMILLIMSTSLYALVGAPMTYACSGNCQSLTNTPTAVVTLNGTDQMVSYPLEFSLNNIGTIGWHVSITSTQFATGSNPAHMLSVSASSVIGVTAVCQTGQTCTADPQNAMRYPVGVPVTPNAVAFYDTQTNSGIGSFDVIATINTVVPANAYSGMYTSTITIALSDGP